MQPMISMPPVPRGRAALDAWRGLDRGVRRELMRGDRPHPDPTTAVIALGYARTMLSRTAFRRILPVVPLWFAWTSGAMAVAIFAGHEDHLGIVGFVALLPVVLAEGLLRRRRLLAWHRMESVHAAALWATERGDPLPPVPRSAAAELAVGHDIGAVARIYGLMAAVLLLCGAVMAVVDPILGLVIGALLVFILVWGIARTALRRRRGHAFVHLRVDGVELSVKNVRSPWSAFTEIRISPYRGSWVVGGRNRHHVVGFVAADAEALIAGLPPSFARRARNCLKAYGAPIAVADVALDRNAEEMAASASALSGLPIRRFGP